MSGCGGMADALDLGSSIFDVGVQVPSSAPLKSTSFGAFFVFLVGFVGQIMGQKDNF